MSGRIETESQRILDDALTEHRPSHTFALFSGGRDSWCATDVAARHLGDRLSGVVFVNTGTAFTEAVEYVRRVAPQWGRLLEYAPPSGHTFEDIVREHGFPGPAQHGRVYVRLKERALDALVRDHKTHRYDRIALISGARQAESKRRERIPTVERDGATVWINAIVAWEDADKHRYLDQRCSDPNPCWDTVCRSGDCNCGAFAKNPGERETIEFWHPEMGVRITEWERLAAEHGKPCRWGYAPAVNTTDPMQMPLFDDASPDRQRLCFSCVAPRQEAA